MDLKNMTLGIEFGSTRIKAVLIDERHVPAASGSFDWENRLEDGIWTYSLEEVHRGLQACYADLAPGRAGEVRRAPHGGGGPGRLRHDARLSPL